MRRLYPLKRDKTVEAHHFYTNHAHAGLPSSVDMRSRCTAVRDQGQLGICTGMSGAALMECFDASKTVLSPLFEYYYERKDDGDINEDAGSTISESVHALTTYGISTEALDPLDPAKFAQPPPPAALSDAAQRKAIGAAKVLPDLTSIKTALSTGHPIQFGFDVYESFETVDGTGRVPMPKPGEQILGGHAVLMVGYDDKTQTFLVRNSWGSDWGDKGYCHMPYAYLQHVMSDLWTISSVTHPPPLPPSPLPPSPSPSPAHPKLAFDAARFALMLSSTFTTAQTKALASAITATLSLQA